MDVMRDLPASTRLHSIHVVCVVTMKEAATVEKLNSVEHVTRLCTKLAICI